MALTLVTMVGTTAPFIGVLGLFTSPTWRDPRAHFLVGVAAAALVGPVVFASPSLNQAYFLLVAPPALVLAGVWGFHVLATRVDPARLPRLLALGALPGLALAGLAVAAERNAWATVPTLPNIGARILVLLLVIFLVSLVAHRADGAGRLVAVTTTLAVGCAFLMSWSWTLAAEPRALFRPDPPAQALIGPRGVEAARWIRAHSRADDVVVVNAHCLLPPERPRCDRRNAWVSAFTERQVLVESWAYSRRAKLESERTGVGRMTMDFWDPGLLSLNDRAFTSRDPALLRQLRDQHGVRWMFADRRFPVRIERLRKVAEERADFGRYVVFAVR